MKATEAFKRAKAMFAALQAALVLSTGDQQLAIAALGVYKSRGKGGKHRTANRTITGRWVQDRSKYMPRECTLRGCR